MRRKPNTTVDGEPFDEITVQEVWNKCEAVPGTAVLKVDCCGTMIARDEFGQTSTYGWEIDHIKPVAKGGTDDLANLQALHWENNRQKADHYPEWLTKIRRRRLG